MAGPATPIDGEPWTSDEVDEATQQIIDHNAELAQRVGNRTLTQLEDDLSATFAQDRRLRAQLGWRASMAQVLALDSGEVPAANLDGAMPDYGPTWQVLSGTWSRADGVIQLASAATEEVAVMDLGTPDVRIEVDPVRAHPTSSRTCAIACRVIDSANFLLVALDWSDYVNQAGVRIIKIEAGASTALASLTLPVGRLGGPVRLGATLAGTDVGAHINGQFVVGHTLAGGDATTFASQTKHGLATSNAVTFTYQWRNFAAWKRSAG